MTADPPGATASPRPWLVTWVVLGGLFAVGINFTILAVSRPTIADDLGADPNALVWLISGPILANALATTTAGKLGDLYGHRRVYLYGIAGTAVFALASGLATDAWTLVALRILGSVTGAAMGPATLATINLTVPPGQRSRAMGYWSLVAAGGPVIGLIIGGPLVDAFGWEWIFLGQVPLLVAAGVAAWWLVPRDTPSGTAGFDVVGNVLLATSLVAVMVAVERGRAWGWSSVATTTTLLGGLILLGVFVAYERRVAVPLIPLRYFRTRTFTVPIAVIFFTQFGYMGGFILAPKLLDDVGGVSATTISQLLIPRPLTFAIVGSMSGILMGRLGVRRIAFGGAVFVSLSLVLMSLVGEDLSYVLVVVAIAFSGLGMGATQPAVAASVADAVDDGDLGIAGASQQMVAQVATSLGMNLMDSVQASLVASVGLVGSYSRAYLLGAVATLGGAAVALLLPRQGRAELGRATR